jgi:hypothetical protein
VNVAYFDTSALLKQYVTESSDQRKTAPTRAGRGGRYARKAHGCGGGPEPGGIVSPSGRSRR